MVLCLGEPPRRFLWRWLSFLVFMYLFLHFVSRLHYHVTDTPPWFLRSIKASTSSEFYPDYFWLSFLFHLPRVLQFWVGIFYPPAFFTLHSFTNILTCVYQGFPGSWQLFFEVCRASYWSSKHRPNPSVCFIHSNPQSLYILNLHLYMSIFQKFYLWWKLW